MEVVQTVQVWTPNPRSEPEDGSGLRGSTFEEDGWTPPNVLTYYAPVWFPDEEGAGLRLSTFDEEGWTPPNTTLYVAQSFTADEEGAQLRKTTFDEEGYTPLNTTTYAQPPLWFHDEEGTALRTSTFDDEGVWPQPVASTTSNPLWAEPEEYKLPPISFDDDGWSPVNSTTYVAQSFTVDEEGAQLRLTTFDEEGVWVTPTVLAPLSPNWTDEETLARMGYEEEGWTPVNTTVYSPLPVFTDNEELARMGYEEEGRSSVNTTDCTYTIVLTVSDEIGAPPPLPGEEEGSVVSTWIVGTTCTVFVEDEVLLGTAPVVIISSVIQFNIQFVYIQDASPLFAQVQSQPLQMV
jgi:hypothetical protein